MTPEEVRAFLLRWVFEVGDGWIEWLEEAQRFSNDWYGQGMIGVGHPDIARFFDREDWPNLRFRINQKGLDYIKEG